jgi:hypothetical protein
MFSLTLFASHVAIEKRSRQTLLTSGLFLLMAVPAFCQTGQIVGRIVDPAGAVVPDVKIQITQTTTGVVRQTASNSDGYFTAPNLLPGIYTVRLEHPGFKPLNRTGVQLEVDQDLRFDFTLEVGSLNEQITVTGQEPLLETENSSIGQVVQSAQIVNLPLLGRDTYSLAELVPGVRPSAGMNQLPVDIITTSSISINGAPGSANSYLLDGAPNTAPAQNQPIIYPNPDLVQEFKVETNNISAEYGRAAGGVFNIVTKAGTNELHGDAYEFFRNNVLDANDFFANTAGKPIPPLKFNQFGGTLGGPVIIPHIYNGHNKTFFFVNAELVRYIQGVTYTATVPNPVELTGNFSNDVNAKGQKIIIYNPASTVQNGSTYTRAPFAGNVIPTAQISPIAAKIATYWPAPNVANAAVGANNYVNVEGNHIQKNTFSTRLDQNFTDNTRMFVRYSYDDSPWTRASPYGVSDPGSPAYGPQDFIRYNAVSEVDHVFSPSLVGVVRAAFSRLSNFRNPLSIGYDITQLGLPSNLQPEIGSPAAFPAVTVTGYGVNSSVSNNSGGQTLGETGVLAIAMNNYSLESNLTKTLSKHEIKFGGQFQVVQYNTLQTGDTSTNFSFTSAFTQGPNPLQATATGGDALATFLLGIPGGSVTPSPALALQTKYYAGYIQDQWRITSNFTLNMGLRYDFETPRTERFNQLTNFNSSAAVPLTVPGLNLQGALSFVGVNGVSRYESNPDKNNVAPRLGFAWQVDKKTVIRSGAGIFYADNWGVGSAPGTFGISGFTATTSVVGSLNGVQPIVNFANPYPQGLNQPTGSSLGAATLLGQSVSFYERNNVTPYAMHWNFDIQRQLPKSILFDITYVGLHALKFPANLTLNQLPDSALQLGSQLTSLVPNPFYGQIAIGTLSARTVAQSQLLVPYPQFTGLTSDVSNWASSNYNALEVKLERRYSNGFSLLASYTWSKLMDYTTGTWNGETLGTGGIQDYNNLKAEYSPSALDQTNRFILNAFYSLPFFQKQKGITGHLLGGWEVGLIGSFYSGSPIGVTAAVNGTDSQGGGQRPNWTGVNPQLSNPTVYQWFNTSVFSQPPAFQFGSAPRSFDSVRSDATHNIDMSLIKNTALTERWKLQFRAEAFNLFNTPVFAPPGTSYGSATFGVVSSVSNQPRVIQFAMKLLF